ncbi:MAG: hypothetical protein JW763_07115 [candidate division Zixibacteria bacterium]|nr:hypothetical protein [candidate division Zixibacteria bacterium]
MRIARLSVFFTACFMIIIGVLMIGCSDDEPTEPAVWGWSALGTGMNGIVGALTVYDGKLIAGGDFTLAGGISASHIAAWNGSSWASLG